ncbi:Chaperone DnaJ-domain superfamily protein putative isoform 1 [Tripterygium wilfordii]|uniref:Chaperone DnaJ-domain superfamily protein putative isoform 1 n=1 Tax=Tripterygium wilfordii TaxID=458696 RepID=A0A7J7CDE9_TRIWF|nr:Chaperone DnaJ-domain superfamily protein putative isoform 1 [Tripterygium wilfordii]
MQPYRSAGNDSSGEAARWLAAAEKVLASGDLHSAKSFAIRAREFDPRLDLCDRIIAVADTILCAAPRISAGRYPDWYAILQLDSLTQNMELIATQYRKLALLLDPQRTRLPLVDQAFRLVSDAWLVLSNPNRKSLYDTELQLGELGQNQQKQTPPKPVRTSPRNKDGRVVTEPEPSLTMATPTTSPAITHVTTTPATTHAITPATTAPASTHAITHATTTPAITHATTTPTITPVTTTPTTTPASIATTTAATASNETASTRPSQSTRRTIQSDEYVGDRFWTACRYCYILYEYPKIYEECTLRCQNCRRAFHAETIPSPLLTENQTHFCCWAVFPLGFSGNAKGANGFANWSPFSPMFACPSPQGCKNARKGKKTAPRFTYDDEDVYVELSDVSEDEEYDDDDEWEDERLTKRSKNTTAKSPASNRSTKRVQSGRAKRGNVEGESSRKKQTAKGAKELGKLDLNVEFSNEVEDPAPVVREGNVAGNGEEDNIGSGFFEGLDEFLSSLPILNVVADDKVRAG